MATLVNHPRAVPSIVDMLGRMDISAQDLQTADDIPVAHMMIDNNSSHTHFVKHTAYESAEAQWGHHCKPQLNPVEYTLPSEFEIDPLLFLPDLLSTTHPLDLKAHRIDDPSIQDDMAIDDARSPPPALPELTDNQYSAAASPLYSTYTDYSLSPPAPSFYNFLEEVGIGMDQYAELSRRYSPDVEWEDMPLSVREYHMQEMNLARVGDLCDETVDIQMSQNPGESASSHIPEEFDITVAANQSNSLELCIETTEDSSLTPLRDLFCIDSFTGGGGEQIESALWALT